MIPYGPIGRDLEARAPVRVWLLGPSRVEAFGECCCRRVRSSRTIAHTDLFECADVGGARELNDALAEVPLSGSSFLQHP